jgi:hypothetical protein
LLPTPPHCDAVTFDYGAHDRLRHGLTPGHSTAWLSWRWKSKTPADKASSWSALMPAKAGTQG